MAQMGTSGSRSCSHHGGSGSGLPPTDRALIAVGHSGSSLAIPLEDVTAIWLDQLDLTKDSLPAQSHHSPVFAPYSPSHLKLELTSSPVCAADPNASREPPAALLLPPPSIYYSHNPSAHLPSVSTELVALLPSSPFKRRKLCNSVEEILTINPCFNWRNFRERLDGMFRWAMDMEAIERAALDPGDSLPRSPTKADAARAIYYGLPIPSEQKPSESKPTEPRPTVSFFAAVAAALAVGAQVNRDNGINDDNGMVVEDSLSNGQPPSRKGTGKKSKASGIRYSEFPAMLFALSEQALDLFEKSNPYDLDYLIALIMQALYMLHDGKPVVDRRLYPLVGKMVNIARMMGLSMDPDEFPGKYSLFEAETRRRLWWDIYCYDLYVSDSMGHPPTIPDNFFTTKLPVDVDETLFSPSSTSIPAPSADEYSSKYFGLKIRMAQLVKSVKKRTFKDPIADGSSSDSASIEEAASFEGEVTRFLKDLPAAFKLDIGADLSALCASPSSPFQTHIHPSSACLIAQQCELVITGQRLILKIYLPFLRPNQSGSMTNASQNPAALGTMNAAHAIIHASRVLHALCKQPPGAKSRRPGPAIFDYYSFGQSLFEAAVVCAHSVIMQPTAIWANVAMDDVMGALEVMRDPVVATGQGSAEGGVSGPVKVIELMKKKAEGVRAGNGSSPAGMSKGQHGESDNGNDQLLDGFQLPYVGAAVASAGSVIGSPDSASHSSPAEGTHSIQSRPNTPHSSTQSHSAHGGGVRRTESEKTKHKKGPYPTIGVRVRPGRESLLARQRALSTAPAATFVETDSRVPAPASMTTSNKSTPVPRKHSFQMSATHEPALKYPSPSSPDSIQPPTQLELTPDSHSNYPPPFANTDSGSMNPNLHSQPTFTIREVGQQQGYSTGAPTSISIYDQGQCNSYNNGSSPVSFPSGPSSQSPLSFGGGGPVGYYAPSPYQSNFDSNSSQGSLLGSNMTADQPLDNASDMDCSITTSSRDIMFDVKPENGNGLQQSFDNVQGQQPWHSGTVNGGQFWQPYYST